MDKPHILIIDDDEEFLSDFTFLLKNDFVCEFATNSNEGIQKIRSFQPDVILLDLMLDEEKNGLQVLSKIHEENQNLPVIIITDYGSVDTAVKAIRMGAIDYISKTPHLDELKIIIEKSLKYQLMSIKAKNYENESGKPFSNLVGSSDVMVELKNRIKLYAESDNTVLITGESGVGKEIVARQIHNHSKRCNNSFVAVNCSAIPNELIESEFFGHEKGSFTGANQRKIGKFELATNGTIFLDEISELNPLAQVKILRVIQEKEFERVGGLKSIKTNARIIAATNQNLEELVASEKFRPDLFYRLNVLPISVPKLSQRMTDLPALINYFTTIFSNEMNSPKKTFSAEAIKIMSQYNWPGNVRELKNFITLTLITSESEIINHEDLNREVFKNRASKKHDIQFEIPKTWEEMDKLRKAEADKAARLVEKLFVQNLLDKFDGNVTLAAEHIGINRSNLHKMIKKCGN
ncbi:MAG: sigma-54 dependent transcriptional regulator [Melioribacteraceae bacterium]|nr:sigma-54 dependent transcriptional regulator [Melioribacteraceae bacterium]MCF8264065.1 sigma-54 dependent transcriptional regulator [Melioribacteraceae bacterium]MCF8413132.1 sigma-54 dependent transcriptional regulator [Melioribacteraceae bacterium]MCF8430834.1 sigma-54 dependent transcriptional regulator [Melioribacteraceae bacterium]